MGGSARGGAGRAHPSRHQVRVRSLTATARPLPRRQGVTPVRWTRPRPRAPTPPRTVWLRLTVLLVGSVTAIVVPFALRFPELGFSLEQWALLALATLGFPALAGLAAHLDDARPLRFQADDRWIATPVGQPVHLDHLRGWTQEEDRLRCFLKPPFGRHERTLPLPEDGLTRAALLVHLTRFAPQGRPAGWRSPPVPWHPPRPLLVLGVTAALVTGVLVGVSLHGDGDAMELAMIGLLVAGPGTLLAALAPRGTPLGARLPVMAGLNLLTGPALMTGFLYGLPI